MTPSLQTLFASQKSKSFSAIAMLNNSYIVWEGASLIDGSPIVLILTGFVNHTLNRKTGRLLQSWIIQQNLVPTEAAKKGFEKGICGDCPLKLSQTGACFVNLLPVNNIYRKYFAGNYPKLSANEIEILKRYRYPIRIGSYGDPTAVPFDVWEPIISASSGHTGYTHRWNSNECDELWKKYLMASVQSESEARIAQNLGWRTFRIIAPDAPLSENEILCRNTEDDTVRCVMSYKILTYLTSTTIERIFIVEYDSIYNAQSAYTGIDSTFTTRA